MANQANMRPYCAGLGHPAICNLLIRLERLRDACVLTVREDQRAFFISGNLENFATWH
jgi:hypothetical protein